MHPHSTRWISHLAMLALSTGVACVALAAEDGPVDCGKFKGIRPQDVYKEDPKEIHECIYRGWDPPVNWRPDKGKGPGIRVGGAGGFSHGSVSAPDMPPWRSSADGSSGGASSGSSSSSSSSGIDFPPWDGWPFSSGGSGSSGSSSSGSGSSSSSGGGCPTSNDDADATFGEKKPLTGSVSLTCGGAVPSTTYQLSLSAGADMLLLTEYGFFNYWVYKKEGASYKLVSAPNAMLPNTVCGGTALQPPIAQMISFKSSASQIAIRLKQTEVVSDPLAPVVAPAVPEKHVVLSVSGGTVQVPESCVDATAYKTTTAIGDIVFDTVMSGGCEAPPEICTATGASPTPTALPDCQMAVYYPPGSGCSDKTQIILLDRPNLLYPPGSTATPTPIEGMTAVMLPTVAESMIQTKDGWIVRLGEPGAAFTLPQGGTVGLADGNRLRMDGPATISGSGGITLTKGGALQNQGGSILVTYPDNTTLNPAVIKPVVMKINQSVKMPAGYMVPSSPTARVRLPVTTP